MKRENYYKNKLKRTVPLRQGDERRERSECSGGGMAIANTHIQSLDLSPLAFPLWTSGLEVVAPLHCSTLVILEEGTVH